MSFKILIIGQGGREHAIAWNLSKHSEVDSIYVAPGNGGTFLEENTNDHKIFLKNKKNHQLPFFL